MALRSATVNNPPPMSQMRLSDFEYAGKRKQTRRERFLAVMELGRIASLDRAASSKGEWRS